jgi:hypothetical protein
MILWHNTGDASRIPEQVMAGDEVVLWAGTHPIEPGQTVWVEMTLTKPDGRTLTATQPAGWHSNNEYRNNSYWIVPIGIFDQGDHLEYRVCGRIGETSTDCGELFAFDVA